VVNSHHCGVNAATTNCGAEGCCGSDAELRNPPACFALAFDDAQPSDDFVAASVNCAFDDGDSQRIRAQASTVVWPSDASLSVRVHPLADYDYD